MEPYKAGIRKFTKEIAEIPIEINIYADDQNYFEQAANQFSGLLKKMSLME